MGHAFAVQQTMLMHLMTLNAWRLRVCSEFVAHGLTEDEICRVLGADGLIYQVGLACTLVVHVLMHSCCAPFLAALSRSQAVPRARQLGLPAVFQHCRLKVAPCPDLPPCCPPPQDVSDLLDCGRDLNPHIAEFDDSCFTGAAPAPVVSVAHLPAAWQPQLTCRAVVNSVGAPLAACSPAKVGAVDGVVCALLEVRHAS
jgi:hypothetical protein